MDTTSIEGDAFQKRIDLRQDPRYAKFVKEMDFVVVKIKTSVGFAFGFIKYIPVLRVGMMKIQRYRGEIDSADLGKKIRENWVWKTILEPIDDKRIEEVAHIDKESFLPTKTRVIKISDFESGLSDNIKRILKKKNNSIQVEADTDVFYDAWKKYSKIWTLSRKTLRSLKRNFGDDCILWLEKDQDEVLGGIICLISDGWAYYFAAFVSDKGRKTNGGIWGIAKLVELLRRRKVSYFDFEGVFDLRFPKDSWKGFSVFKSKFGGKTIELPGCYSRWF